MTLGEKIHRNEKQHCCLCLHVPYVSAPPGLSMGKITLDSYCFLNLAAAVAKSLQLCPTLCDPIDGSPPGSAVPGILQARTLEWVAISF